MAWKISKAEASAARQRSWETRRAKYGPAGHAGYYSRPATRPDTRLGRLVALLIDDEILTEGQVARIIECDRIAVRRIADEGAASLRYRPLTGDWGAATMRRLIAKRG